MSTFEDAIYTVLCHEGDKLFVDKENGEYSKYGITLKFLQAVEPEATAKDIEEMSEARAARIYKEHWWEKFKYGRIDSQRLATKVLDIAANTSPTAVVRCLQMSVNCILGRNELKCDGVLGPATAAAVNAIDSDRMLQIFKAHLELHYREIAEKNPSKRKYLDGWLARVADGKIYAASDLAQRKAATT